MKAWRIKRNVGDDRRASSHTLRKRFTENKFAGGGYAKQILKSRAMPPVAERMT
jgi:hypothetical protein